MISHGGFNLQFLMTSDVGYLFMYLLCFHIFLLEKCLFMFFAHFLIVFCVIRFCVFFFMFLVLTSYQIHSLQAFFSPFFGVFSLLWWFLSLCRSFLVLGSLISLFCCLCFRYHIQKLITETRIKELCSYVFFQEFHGFRSYI